MPEAMARVLLKEYGVPLTAWQIEPDLAPAVHRQTRMETEHRAVRRGRPAKSGNTPLAAWKLATGETDASIAAALKMSRRTVQAYDRGERTAPLWFREKVHELSKGRVDVDGWPRPRD